MSKKKKILGLALGGSLLFGAPMGASAALSASVPNWSSYGVTGIQGFGTFDAGSLNKSRSNHQAAKELKANIVAAVKAKAEAAAKEEASVVVPEVTPEPIVTPEEEKVPAEEKGEEEKVPAEEKGEASEEQEKLPEATTENQWIYDEDLGRWCEVDSEGDYTGRYKLTEDGEIKNTAGEGEGDQEQGGEESSINEYTFTYNGYDCTVYYDSEGNPVSISATKNGKTTSKSWEDVSSKNQKIILAQLNNYLNPEEGGEASEGSDEEEPSEDIPYEKIDDPETSWVYDNESEKWIEVDVNGDWTGNWKWAEDGEIHSSGSSSEEEGNGEVIGEDDWSVDENTNGSIEQQYHWELNEDGVWMEIDSYGNWTGKTSDTDPTAKSETSTEESAVEQQGCLITIDGITYLTNYDENGNLTSVKRASSGYEYSFDDLDSDVLDKLREETKSFYDANNSGTASEEETPKKDKVSTEQMPTSYSYDLNTFEVVGYDENGNELVRNPMSSVEKDLGGRTCTVYLDMDGNPVIVYEHQEGMTVSWDDLTDELKNEYYTGSQTTEDTSAPAEGEAMAERVIIDVSAQQASIGEDFSAIANKQNELEALASEIQNKQNELNSCDDPDQRTVLENELEEMLVQSADIESEIAYYEHEIEVLREEIANEAAKGQQLESEGYEVDYVGFDWETQK